jgi:hypothetical protein
MKILLLLLILILTLFYTKEGFVEEYKCSEYTDCKTCATVSGCSWCPKAKLCIFSKNLLSTDECNQMNVINSSSGCDAENRSSSLGNGRAIKTYDLSLYKNQINNKFAPPNVYTAHNVEYSNEDVISSTNNVRNEIDNLRKDMPDICSRAMYETSIQGFEDLTQYAQW